MRNSLIPHFGKRQVQPAASLPTFFDDFFSDFWRDAPGRALSREFVPQLDVHESDDSYRVVVELPGLEAKDFEVSLEDDILTIKGEKRFEKKHESEGQRYVETRYGSFERRLRVPENVDAGGLKANHKNGVVEITLPKRPEPKPEVRTIPVTSA